MATGILEQSGTITAASGTGSATIAISKGVFGQLYINATTSTTTFDASLTNGKSIVFYDDVDITGTLSTKIDLPVVGNCTLTIANASVDEDFTYYVSIIERYA